MHPVREVDDPLGRVAELARVGRASLSALARSEGVTPEDAVDCVQEALCTMLDLARRGELTEDPAEWRPLLAGIVRNAARNRRRRHFRALPHDDIDESGEADGAPPADELLARAEERGRLKVCVQELCEIHRAVVTLRMLEEQPGEDVAAAMGISPGHVAVLLHRAKRALRACMAPAGCSRQSSRLVQR